MRALDSFAYHSPLAPVISIDVAIAEPGKDGKPVGDITAPFIPFESILDASRTAQAVRDFVASLPPSSREMIFQHFWGDQSKADIARRMGVSGAAISKSMAKILKRGRSALSGYRAEHMELHAA